METHLVMVVLRVALCALVIWSLVFFPLIMNKHFSKSSFNHHVGGQMITRCTHVDC